ncbi:MAG: hypothetical protein ACE5I5_18760 [Candidatus Heimdallarchaeota archaeon]
MSLQRFFQGFVQAIAHFASQGVLTTEILQHYSKAKRSLHGILESALVQAGWGVGWLPVVEPRVPYLNEKSALDSYRYNPNLARTREGEQKRPRKRHHFRPDVGYYRNDALDVFAECCTTDEASEYIPSRQTPQYDRWKRGWITKRDAFLHFVQHSKMKVSTLVICVTLPRQMKKKPPWLQFKSVGNDFFNQFKPGWDTLAQDLQQYASTDLIIVEENGVHVNNVHYPVEIP